LLSQLKHAAEFGLKLPPAELDYASMAKRKDAVVTRLTRGVAGLFKNANVTLVAGRARVLDARTVEVAAHDGSVTRLEGKSLLVASGSEAARPKVWPFDNPRVMTSDEALALTRLPASVLIVGGGYIGCEFASMWAELGSKVTLVEMLPGLLPLSDADVAKEMERSLLRRRVKVLTGTKIEKLIASADKVVAELSNGTSIETDIAFVAVGRKLNSDVEGLASLGVKLDGQAIAVDEFGRTNLEGIRAIGDVTGKCLLAHYAQEQGVVAMEHLFGKDPHPLEDWAVPSCVFTIPEIAHVGLTEAQAREKFDGIRVGRFPMLALGKAIASGDTSGFVKVVGDASGTVLGVHMVGHEVTSMIAEATLAVRLKLKMSDLVHTIHAHPTMPEALHEAALDFMGRAIHKM
jgi:dihydrolipoamide dehydrogenase